MATYTEKYNLKKPDETDFIDIADINENMDKIDKTLDNVKQTVIPISERAVANGVATLDENGKIPAEQLSAVGILPRLDVTAANGVTVTVTDGTTILSEISTGTVSFNLPNFGDWRIEAGSYIKTVEIDTVKIYKITALALNDASWEQIAEISESGKAMDIWALGDEKNITVAGEELTLVIVDFDHDDKSDNSGKAGLTFGLKNLMTNNRSISGLSSNANGFTGTNTYSWLHSELFLNFPVDLQNVIKSVDKKTSIGNMNTDIIVDSMKVFLFSEIEIFGEVTYSAEGEGTQYPYFATLNNRKKYYPNDLVSSKAWWERSPSIVNTSSFCYVQGSGNAFYGSAGSLRSGVCFGFCV